MFVNLEILKFRNCHELESLAEPRELDPVAFLSSA